jgi:hypothetical protein
MQSGPMINGYRPLPHVSALPSSVTIDSCIVGYVWDVCPGYKSGVYVRGVYPGSNLIVYCAYIIVYVFSTPDNARRRARGVSGYNPITRGDN